MRSSINRIRLIALILIAVAGTMTASAANAQRPETRPYFDGYSGFGNLINFSGRMAEFYPESADGKYGAWLINGTGGRDRIVVYTTNAWHVRKQTGWKIKGTFESLNSLSWLGVDFTDSTGKLIYTNFIPKAQVNYIVVDSKAGNDTIVISTDVDAWIETGSGEDFVSGGDGNDYIENTSGFGDIRGRGGNDTLVGNIVDIYNKPSGGLLAPRTFMYGGIGTDTYIYNGQDWIEDTVNGDRINYAWDGWVTPAELTWGTGRYKGMNQVTMDEDFLFEYAVDDFGPAY